LLGIGRGADLVFYCGILAMLVGFLLFYIRYRRVEEEITLLVRHIALLEAEAREREKGAASE
jgi:small membrane protein